MSASQPQIRVTVWGENAHEHKDANVRELYPQGMHGAIASGITEHLGDSASVKTVAFTGDDTGLTSEILANTDVLTWWGHIRHDDVSDEVVEAIYQRVQEGMGLLVLHSGHHSKIFKKLMGTSCNLDWRNDADQEVVWTVKPSHPIAQGVPHPFVIPAQEMYGEHFDIPEPDELIFISSFSGGEVFRSGLTYTRGNGRIFYFSPGDQDYPVYHQAEVRRVIANGVAWAFNAGGPRTAPVVNNRAERGWFLK